MSSAASTAHTGGAYITHIILPALYSCRNPAGALAQFGGTHWCLSECSFLHNLCCQQLVWVAILNAATPSCIHAHLLSTYCESFLHRLGPARKYLLLSVLQSDFTNTKYVEFMLINRWLQFFFSRLVTLLCNEPINKQQHHNTWGQHSTTMLFTHW